MSSKLVKPNGAPVEENILLGTIEVYNIGCKVNVPRMAPKDLIRALLQLLVILVGECLDNKQAPLVQPVPEDVLKNLPN